MDKKDWEDIIKEPMSESLKARTMARVRQELDRNREVNSRFNWAWLIPLVPVLGALVLFVRQQKQGEGQQSSLVQTDYLDDLTQLSEAELADYDHELLTDLELLEELEVLEEWDGTTTES